MVKPPVYHQPTLLEIKSKIGSCKVPTGCVRHALVTCGSRYGMGPPGVMMVPPCCPPADKK